MAWISQTRELELAEGSIRYRDLGAGPPLLFVHGLLANGNLWRGVVPPLARRFRCIVPDWPLGSHELPMRADADLGPTAIADMIVRFADALALDDATLVANDTGGAISQIAVARHPRRFARLVLTNCDAFENFLPPRYRYLCWAAHVPGAIFVLAQTLRPRLLRRLPIAYGPLTRRPLPAEISDSYVNPIATSAAIRRDAGKLLRAISPKLTLDAAERLREFQGRSLLVWAVDDRIFTVDYARRLAALLPSARLETVSDARTFLPEDRPELLAERIAAFLDSTSAASDAAARAAGIARTS